MPIDKSIDYSAITPEIKELTKLCLADNVIEPEMYVKYAVNRGLRDLNGNGVLTGLTEISEILAVSYTHLDVYKRQDTDVSGFWPKLVEEGEYTPADLARTARMHKAIACLLYTSRCV